MNQNQNLLAVNVIDDATRALAAGRAANVGAANLYAGRSLVLAKAWHRGYQLMLLQRWYTSRTASRT